MSSQHLSFYNTSRVASAICLGLAVVWMLAPQLLLQVWQIEAVATTVTTARRSGALFLGFALMLWLVRDAKRSPERDAIAAGVAISCTVLPVLGVYEFATGHAGPGIWLAVFVEASLAIAFIKSLTEAKGTD